MREHHTKNAKMSLLKWNGSKILYEKQFVHWKQENQLTVNEVAKLLLFRGPAGGGGGESDIARLNFKTSRVGVYKRFMSLSEIGRKLLAFVGILEKGDSDAL